MPDDFFYNPIFWVFISYTIGALLTPPIFKTNFNKYLLDNQFLNDKWTKRIGVLHFGWLIRHSFMGLFNQKLKYTGKLKQEKLLQLKQEMTFSELGHLTAFFFLIILNLLFIYWKLDWGYIIGFFILNIIFNFYLVLLQQYNKRRIDKLLKTLP